MRLCYIAPAGSTHTKRWLSAFVERGHQVHLIVLPGETPEIDGLVCHFLRDGSPKVRFAQWVFACRRILNEIHPDVLHAHYLGRYGWLAAFTLFHPLVLTAWGSDVYVDPLRSRVQRWLTEWSLRQADLVTADSKDLANQTRTMGARQDRVHIVQWGIDTALFRRDIPTSGLRARLKLGDGPVILCTRGLRPNYNQDVLLRAFATVLMAIPRVQLLLKYNAYDSAYLDHLKSLATELGVEGAVTFEGEAPYTELPSYYALADVFVSIASSDGTPVSLLEAMACGVVPIASDLSSIREWISDGENGYVVPARNSEVLAQTITCALQSPELKQQFGLANRAIIDQRANHKLEMDRMARLYVQVAGLENKQTHEGEP